jgi:hypothetical protein
VQNNIRSTTQTGLKFWFTIKSENQEPYNEK